MIKVYVIRFSVDGNQHWLRQSYDKDTAFALGKLYGKLGKKPVIVRVEATPHQLLACGACHQRHFSA